MAEEEREESSKNEWSIILSILPGGFCASKPSLRSSLSKFFSCVGMSHSTEWEKCVCVHACVCVYRLCTVYFIIAMKVIDPSILKHPIFSFGLG